MMLTSYMWEEAFGRMANRDQQSWPYKPQQATNCGHGLQNLTQTMEGLEG